MHKCNLEFMKFEAFHNIEEVGSGAYGTIYTAKHKRYANKVVLKRFKNYNQITESFISKVYTAFVLFLVFIQEY